MPLVDGIEQLGKRKPRETAPAFEDAPGRTQRPAPIVVLHGHQSGDGAAMAGDGQAFAADDPFQKPGQVGLGFIGTDAFHSGIFSDREVRPV